MPATHAVIQQTVKQTHAYRFYYHQLDLEHMTAAWLLPIVPAVVAAASGGIVASVLSPDLAFVTLTISYMLWQASPAYLTKRSL